MFETATLPRGGRTVRALTITLSTALQVTAAAAALLYPLLHIEPLPKPELKRAVRGHFVELEPLRPRRSVTARSAMPAPARPFQNPYLAPRIVPTGPPALFDEAPPIASAGIYDPGMPVGAGIPCAGGCEPVVAAPPPPVEQPRREPPPPKKPTPLQTPVMVGGGVKPPEIVHSVQPIYPPLARQARIQGVVRVQAIITRDGTVRSLRLLNGHPLLAPAAMDAVRQWRYRATLLNGTPVEVILQVDVNFTLAH
ncbi:MAG: energy transducer TonB [Bryobacteraceae bacterium]